MTPIHLLRTLGYLALSALPLCYRHIPGLPPFTRSPALLLAGAAFGAARLLDPAPHAPRLRKIALWTGAFLGWQLLSAAWSLPGQRWAVLWPVLHAAAALAIALGIAGDPRRARGLTLVLLGGGAALLVFTFNLLSNGQAEVWTLGGRLQGAPIDHLPFGNRNTAALLIASLLPAALAVAWHARKIARLLGLLASGLLAWLLAETNALGALIGLSLGGIVLLGIRHWRRTGVRPAMLGVGLLLALAAGLAMRLPASPSSWRLTTTLGLRTLVWESAVEGWHKAPLLGLGAGSFALRFPEFRSDLYPLSHHATPRVLHAYNLPLQTLCETGLTGLLLGILVLSALAGAWREGTGRAQTAAAWTCCALLGQALGNDALLEPLGLGCFAVAAGFSLPASAGPGSPKASFSRSALALGLLGIALPVILLQARQARAFAQAHLLKTEAAYRKAARGAIPSLLDLDARFGQGACLMRLGRPAEALAVYRDLLARGGPYGNARREAARAALMAGEESLGLRWLEEHLDFNPCDLEARRLLILLQPDARPRLEEESRHLVAQVPDTHALVEAAADWRCQEGDWEGGWRLYRRVLSASPGRSDVQENVLVAGLRAGRASEALALARSLDPAARRRLREGMDALVSEAPSRPEPRGARALLRWADGDRAGAREDLAAIPPSPDLARWRKPLAELLSGRD